MVLMVFANNISAAEPGRICGWVRDAVTKRPLIAANVYLKDTHIGSTTDDNGNYCIRGIPPGQYQVRIEVIGYRYFTSNIVNIHPGDCQQLNCYLQPEAITFKEGVTVTATRGPNLITEVPASVDVIRDKDLEMSNPQNLAEALQNLQGVFIKDFGGLGNTKTISLRGSTSEQVLVMLDGQRINNPQTGQVDLSSLSVDGIERIEVVRGGNSALYGSDAIGGVINIITRKPSEREGVSGSAKITLAAFNTQSFESNLSLNRQQISLISSYRYLQSANNFGYTDPYGVRRTRENSDICSHDFFLKSGIRFGDLHRQQTLELSWKYYQSERGAPGSIDNFYRRARMWDRANQVNFLYAGKIFNLLNDLRVQIYYHNSWNRYKNDEMLVPTDSRFTVDTYGLEVQMHSVLQAQNSLTYGGGFRADQMWDYQQADKHQRLSYYLFLVNENTWHPRVMRIIKSGSLIPSLRADRYSDFGYRLSPKIGAIMNFGERWQSSIKFNIGTSYRAPTFNDLYWPADAWTQGNPDLKPEYGFDWDAGLRLQYPLINGLFFESTYFQNRMKDLIIWQEHSGKWRPENVDKCLIRGVENSLNCRPLENFLSLQVNYTYLLARNLSPSHTEYNKILVYRPRHTMNVNVSSAFKNINLNYQYNYTSRRFTDKSNIWENSLAPYNVSDVGLNLKYPLWKVYCDFALQIKNIFNEEYSVIKNMPIPGREWRLSLKITF